jgi:hypothetical protein
MRFKKPKIKVARDIIKTASNPVKTKIKKNPIKNLGHYAHATKLPTGAKIGKGTVAKTTKRKLTRTKAQYGVHDV